MALIDNTDITAEEIAKDGLDALDSKYQKSVGFFAWDFFVAIGKILYNVWQKVIYIAKCLTDLSNMDYDDLVNFVFQTRGIVAKTAAASSGQLKVVTGSGTIKAGDIFSTEAGTQFQSLQTVKVAEGDTFEVECTEVGTVGNVAQGAITVIPTTLQGIVSVTNEVEFTNGYDAETKAALLERYYEDIQTPIVSGNIYHYKKWAMECTGVGAVKVKPLWNGANTVKVVILDSNSEIPSEDLVETVQEYIDPKDNWGCGAGQAPIGAYCTVTAPDELKLDISFSLSLSSGYTLDGVKSDIQTGIETYLKSCALTADYISYQKIGAIILGVDGVVDYDNLTINSETKNVAIQDDDTTTEVAVLGELTVTINA